VISPGVVHGGGSTRLIPGTALASRSAATAASCERSIPLNAFRTAPAAAASSFASRPHAKSEAVRVASFHVLESRGDRLVDDDVDLQPSLLVLQDLLVDWHERKECDAAIRRVRDAERGRRVTSRR
jgi:hypothetical protein